MPTKTDSPLADDASETQLAAAAPRAVMTYKDLGALQRDVSHYPEEIRTATHWLQGFYLNHCQRNVQTLRATAAKLGHDLSPEYWRNMLCGDYFTLKSNTWQRGGKAWSNFLQMIEALRRYDEQASRTGRMPFVQTPTYRCISNFITAKRALAAVCKIGGIVAPTGGQTSESFKFYATLNNHGQVIHVEAPASGKLHELETKIAEAYGVVDTKISHRAVTRRTAIRANVNETRCIIIDNCQVLYDARHGQQQPAFNWIRELHDDCRPTFILKFTEEFFRDSLTAGAAKGYFEQFIGRMGGLDGLLKLPAHAPEADLRAIARAFHLEPGRGAMDMLAKWSRAAGRIRIVFEKLQLARAFAQADQRDRITLADLAEADDYSPPAIGTDDEEGGAA